MNETIPIKTYSVIEIVMIIRTTPNTTDKIKLSMIDLSQTTVLKVI